MRIEAPQSNEPSDPAEWVDLHGDALFRFAMTRVHDPELSEELVQETFLAAFRAREGFEGRARERTWLVQILRNKIVDHFRRRRREMPATDLDPGGDLGEELFDEKGHWCVNPGRWVPDPDALLHEEDFLAVLERCLSELPSRQAEVFSLRVLDERSGEEVRNVLGVTASNLAVLLHRARHRLRRCLEINWFESDEVAT